MGCCGRKTRSMEARPVPKGQAVREIAVRPVAPPPPMPKAPVQPPSVVRSPGSSTTIQPTKTIVCKKCGSKIVLKRIWSERLRRYYDVSWCPGCKEES